MRWEFFSNSGDFALMAVFRTDEDTRRPRRREWQQRNQYTEDWGIVRVAGRRERLNTEYAEEEHRGRGGDRAGGRLCVT
jgi:hypothetical protein